MTKVRSLDSGSVQSIREKFSQSQVGRQSSEGLPPGARGAISPAKSVAPSKCCRIRRAPLASGTHRSAVALLTSHMSKSSVPVGPLAKVQKHKSIIDMNIAPQFVLSSLDMASFNPVSQGSVPGRCGQPECISLTAAFPYIYRYVIMYPI